MFTFDHFACFTRGGFVRFHFLSGQWVEFEAEWFRSIVVDLSHPDIDQRNDPARIVHFLQREDRDRERRPSPVTHCPRFEVEQTTVGDHEPPALPIPHQSTLFPQPALFDDDGIDAEDRQTRTARLVGKLQLIAFDVIVDALAEKRENARSRDEEECFTLIVVLSGSW